VDKAAADRRRDRGLAAVLTAQAIARPAPAYAGTDGDVVLGAVNTQTSETTISNATDGRTVLNCQVGGVGLGVGASSESGVGVCGVASTGRGVDGFSSFDTGVFGLSAGNAGIGVAGEGRKHRGEGHRHQPFGTGVAGFSSAGAAGVKGLSDIGTGVHAQSTSGNGAV